METIHESIFSDFEKARQKQTFFRIISILRNEENELFSFDDVRSILKPKSSTYKGVIPIRVSYIVGSEGRYNDFSRLFLPKSRHLRSRWERVNAAHRANVVLPAIRVYELGGLYFVRDGNHRVSVARIQGKDYIDAEVTELNAEIKLDPAMSMDEIKAEVIKYEKQCFLDCTKLHELRPELDMDFTHIGRYDDIINHINGHKYYLNLEQTEEIPFKDAMLSWYDNVYMPIILLIHDEHILSRFPGRTEADLYVWICRHWDLLKRQYGQNYPLRKAAVEFAQTNGKNVFQIVQAFFIKLLNRFTK
jgi:hypothetical protein